VLLGGVREELEVRVRLGMVAVAMVIVVARVAAAAAATSAEDSAMPHRVPDAVGGPGTRGQRGTTEVTCCK
jgi:hypothetical protein